MPPGAARAARRAGAVRSGGRWSWGRTRATGRGLPAVRTGGGLGTTRRGGGHAVRAGRGDPPVGRRGARLAVGTGRLPFRRTRRVRGSLGATCLRGAGGRRGRPRCLRRNGTAVAVGTGVFGMRACGTRLTRSRVRRLLGAVRGAGTAVGHRRHRMPVTGRGATGRRGRTGLRVAVRRHGGLARVAVPRRARGGRGTLGATRFRRPGGRCGRGLRLGRNAITLRRRAGGVLRGQQIAQAGRALRALCLGGSCGMRGVLVAGRRTAVRVLGAGRALRLRTHTAPQVHVHVHQRIASRGRPVRHRVCVTLRVEAPPTAPRPRLRGDLPKTSPYPGVIRSGKLGP